MAARSLRLWAAARLKAWRTRRKKLVRTAGCEEPDAALTAKYEARYQQFRQIYPTCRELFDRLVF